MKKFKYLLVDALSVTAFIFVYPIMPWYFALPLGVMIVFNFIIGLANLRIMYYNEISKIITRG